MKEKGKREWEEDNNGEERSYKKRKKIILSESDIKCIEERIPTYLEVKHTRVIKALFNKWERELKLGKILSRVGYSPFILTLEKKDFSLFKELIYLLPDRQKFLMVSYDDYTIIKKFITLLMDIENLHNNAELMELLHFLTSINKPLVEKVIRNTISNIIENHSELIKDKDNLETLQKVIRQEDEHCDIILDNDFKEASSSNNTKLTFKEKSITTDIMKNNGTSYRSM